MRIWTRVFPLFVCVLFVGLAAGPTARAQDVSNVDLLKAFAGVALGSEYEKREPRILKWEKPVNAAIIGKGYPPLFEQLVAGWRLARIRLERARVHVHLPTLTFLWWIPG